MAVTSTYPIVQPRAEDLIIGTQTYTEENPVIGNPTRNFTVESLVSFVESNTGVNKIIAGQGLTVSPSNGKGDVTISAPTAPQWLTSDAVVTNGVVNYISNLLIPTGSTSIGDYAFLNMNIDAIDFNNQAITSIGTSAFSINKLKGTLTLPSTLLTIGDYAFQDYITITNKIELIEFGNQLTTIGSYAFYKNAITSLSIPSSVTTIDGHAFKQQGDNLGTRTLASLTFEPRTTALTISNNAFEYNAITSVNIPANTVLGYYSFGFDTAMSSVTIGDNCTLGQTSFYNNKNISSLTIGDNVSFLGSNVFGFDAAYPDFLTSVNIPSTTTFGSGYTFSNRRSLTTFTVANGANSFWPQTINLGVAPDGIFLGCGLTEVNIDSNVTVGVAAFSGNLLTSISIGSNATLQSSAFSSNPLTSISIGEGVTLGPNAFGYNSGIISTLTIPGTTIFVTNSSNSGAFLNNGVGSITNLIIEEGITVIPRYYFYRQGIESIVLPSTIVEIGEFAFNRSNISGTLTFASVISIGSSAFRENPGITTVNVPIGSIVSGAAFDAGVTINYV
mgnify:CR=1 FL=1